MNSIKTKISDIKLNPNNPRLIKDDKFKKLVKSIKDFPEMLNIRPIVVNKDMIILGGNMRFKACKEAGLKEIPVIIADNLTEEQEREFLIKDNTSGGEWDFDMLANEWDIEQLEEWGLDVPDFEIEEISAEDDNYQVPTEIHTDILFGDYFEIGNHRLLCGDSTKIESYELLMKGEKSDLIFTDPPYDLEDNYSNYIIEQAKQDSHIFIMNSDKLLVDNINNNHQFFRKFFAVDFRQARLVSNNQPMTRVDLIAEFCKGKTKFKNTFDGFSTLIECAKIHNNNEEINFGHKQAKKIDLPAKFIEHYSDSGDLVCDFFGGSGSTMHASEQMNRKCYSIEFEPKNCQIIINRMIKTFPTLNILKNGVKYISNILDNR